jgi:2-phospho-L-lactate/phosphoenolpyruvate guanylyltransferase
MTTVAILPVKSFGRAKQRLADSLAPQERRALAEQMLTSVLTAVTATVQETVVVTGDAHAAALARRHGAAIVDDRQEIGQSHAVRLGIAHAAHAERVLCIPGDCPALQAQELTQLLDTDADVVIVPDRHGAGTNALVLRPPQIIEPSFGEGSFARHAALARAAWASIAVVQPPGLLHDVDTPADLEALRNLSPRAVSPSGQS